MNTLEKLEDKYSLAEWLASEQGESVGWCEDFIAGLAATGKHKGDCTKESQPCNLCLLESLLEDYRKYVFPEATAGMRERVKELTGLMRECAERFFKNGAQSFAANVGGKRLSTTEDMDKMNKTVNKQWQAFKAKHKI